MSRITEKNLEALARRINQAAGTPETYMTKPADGSRTINVGHYHVDYAYGGSKFVQTVSDGGGIRTITGSYAPKRETYELMQAFLNGLESGK